MAPLSLPKREEEAPPWRPWHSYSNMCWAKVSQVRHDVNKGAEQPQRAKSSSYLSSDLAAARCSSQGSSFGKTKRSYVMHAVPTKSISATSMHDRPSWNQRIATAKWPELSGKSHGSKPQTNSCTININSMTTPVQSFAISENDIEASGMAANVQRCTLRGCMNLSADNSDSLLYDDAALTAVARGIASAASIDASNVEVTLAKHSRSASSSGRPKAAGSTVRLNYAINLPASLSSADHDAATSNIMSLTTAQLNTIVKQKFKQLESRGTSELLPMRSKFNYGRMKNSETGKRQHWVDNWQSAPQLKYIAGQMFCCPGPPPRHLYMDEYLDER